MAEVSGPWGVWRVVCRIDVDEADFPWLAGSVTAGPAFDGCAPLFARVRELAGRAWFRFSEEPFEG
ncbi:hypothetical protein [Actinosynnema sp.]|uniref:hypothetical protein n=1 Tax=Actinosynnema sp. TaxID=1872144 RepID=UPI003F863544